VGLLAGGVLTQAVNWHWIFFVNLPIGIAALVLALRLIERDPGLGLRQGADVAGAILVTSGLMLGVYTIVEARDYGWTSARTLGFGALAALLLAGFFVRQARAANPLLPLGLFRSRNVSGANLVQVLMVAGMFGTFFLGALYLQRVLGYDPMQIGLAFLPVAVAIGALSFRFSADLNARFGARTMLLIGLTLMGAGLGLFARAPVGATYLTDVLPPMVLIGVGGGLTFPSLMTLGMSGATASDSGLISGLINTTAQVGGSLGLAVLATLATSRTDHLLAAGQGTASALTGGYRLAFGTGAGLVAIAIVVAITVLRPEAAGQAVTARANDEEPSEAAA
jgi:MFS family permease